MKQHKLSFAALLALCGWSGTARAEVIMTVEFGAGFFDNTPATPVGGNTGTTVGAQRRIAFQYAADLWGQTLDSDVPVVIDASFTELPCVDNTTTLGSAGPTAFARNLAGLEPNVYYPVALAEGIFGEDLNDGDPDIVAEFNSGLEECLGEDFYYGLDGASPNGTDLIETVIHELGHGLGFLSAVDVETGEGIGDQLDIFSTHVFDLERNTTWQSLTPAQRVASLRTPGGVVWQGDAAQARAPHVLSRGTPEITTEPNVWTGPVHFSEPMFGVPVTGSGVTAPLEAIAPASGCSPSNVSLLGSIALVGPSSNCGPLEMALNAVDAGASAVLIVDAQGVLPPKTFYVPPDDEIAELIDVPVLVVSEENGAALRAGINGGLTVTLSANNDQLVGADAQGRPYLYAEDPPTTSAISHWGTFARPDLVMEPRSGYPTRDLSMEVAVFLDMGWNSSCGNEELDTGEQCDDGVANSDTSPNTCRTTCRNPFCGDGVVDVGETCDDGPSNSDVGADACRSTCIPSSCGDGVVDNGEPCDWGVFNSNTLPDSCRIGCHIPACGDGVIDVAMGELCDNGVSNGDTGAATCSTACAPRTPDVGAGGSNAGGNGSVEAPGGSAGDSGTVNGGNSSGQPTTGGAGGSTESADGGEDSSPVNGAETAGASSSGGTGAGSNRSDYAGATNRGFSTHVSASCNLPRSPSRNTGTTTLLSCVFGLLLVRRRKRATPRQRERP